MTNHICPITVDSLPRSQPHRRNKLNDSRALWVYAYEPNNDDATPIDVLSEMLYERYFARNEVLTKKHLWLLLKDLAINWLQSETQYLAIKLNKNAYSPGTVYHHLEFKYNATSKLIEILQIDDLIEFHQGFNDRDRGIGYISRFKAAANLIGMFQDFGVKESINRIYPIAKPLSSIEIRDASKRAIDFVPTAQVKAMIDEVARYNEALEVTNIDVTLDGYPFPVKIDLTRKFVRRIFNNNTIEQGGRLAGAWWLSCPSDIRSRILIGRLEAVEFDLKALHPVLLYAEQGFDYFVEIGGDPYEVCDVESVINRPVRDVEQRLFRNVFKQIFLVLINNTDEEKAKGAYWQEVGTANRKARKEGRPLPYPERLSPEHLNLLWANFKEAHAVIDACFAGSGNAVPASMRLMRLDSDYIMQVLMKMLDNRVVCLSVHDSLIVPFSSRQLAERVMREVFMDVLVKKGIRPVQARPKEEVFYKAFQEYGKQSYIEDKALQRRAMISRPQYLNYFPASPY